MVASLCEERFAAHKGEGLGQRAGDSGTPQGGHCQGLGSLSHGELVSVANVNSVRGMAGMVPRAPELSAELHVGLRIRDGRHCCGLKFWSGALHNIRLGKRFWEFIATNSFVQGPTCDCITALWVIPGRYYSPDSFFKKNHGKM